MGNSRDRIEQMRARITEFHLRTADQFEAQAIALFRLAGERRSLAGGTKYLLPEAVEEVHGMIDKAEEEQAQALAKNILDNAVAQGMKQ